MSELKITIDQLKNYLGTGLKCDEYGELIGIRRWVGACAEFKDETGSRNIPIGCIKPICYRLSDLDKEIEVDGKRFVPLIELCKIAFPKACKTYPSKIIKSYVDFGALYSFHFNAKECSFECRRDFNGKRWDFNYYIPNQLMLFQKLFEWHFWLFGDEYFDQGFVIDKMKVK